MNKSNALNGLRAALKANKASYETKLEAAAEYIRANPDIASFEEVKKELGFSHEGIRRARYMVKYRASASKAIKVIGKTKSVSKKEFGPHSKEAEPYQDTRSATEKRKALALEKVRVIVERFRKEPELLKLSRHQQNKQLCYGKLSLQRAHLVLEGLTLEEAYQETYTPPRKKGDKTNIDVTFSVPFKGINLLHVNWTHTALRGVA